MHDELLVLDHFNILPEPKPLSDKTVARILAHIKSLVETHLNNFAIANGDPVEWYCAVDHAAARPRLTTECRPVYGAALEAIKNDFLHRRIPTSTGTCAIFDSGATGSTGICGPGGPIGVQDRTGPTLATMPAQTPDYFAITRDVSF